MRAKLSLLSKFRNTGICTFTDGAIIIHRSEIQYVSIKHQPAHF